MASELSKFIEDELKQRGIYEDEKKGLIKETPSKTSNALRFESRVREQQVSQKAKTLTRNLCIVGGILLVVVVWIVLLASSGTNDSSVDSNVNSLQSSYDVDMSSAPEVASPAAADETSASPAQNSNENDLSNIRYGTRTLY
eukprot:TRINITY_DN15067_c0_g1_i2.p5 TRINITY_DN15067_c0_g1~~TRINITY_DN15067_c0_g1_i2.p5  ORF type:complete len:142 (-),score=17.52 TRINITY_DN15067_c0_g1_i2:465-890(-)